VTRIEDLAPGATFFLDPFGAAVVAVVDLFVGAEDRDVCFDDADEAGEAAPAVGAGSEVQVDHGYCLLFASDVVWASRLQLALEEPMFISALRSRFAVVVAVLFLAVVVVALSVSGHHHTVVASSSCPSYMTLTQCAQWLMFHHG
jgi:hypothetical protein